jgi:hypothetical protein
MKLSILVFLLRIFEVNLFYVFVYVTGVEVANIAGRVEMSLFIERVVAAAAAAAAAAAEL